jgi:hypothetical protein
MTNPQKYNENSPDINVIKSVTSKECVPILWSHSWNKPNYDTKTIAHSRIWNCKLGIIILSKHCRNHGNPMHVPDMHLRVGTNIPTDRCTHPALSAAVYCFFWLGKGNRWTALQLRHGLGHGDRTLTQNLLQHVSWPIITGNLHWLYKTLGEHLPNVEMHPLFPSEQPQFIGAWILQGVGCWPMLTPMLPTFVSNCPLGGGPLYFGRWTILETHRKLLSVKNPTELQFLTQTSAPGTYHTPFKGT